MGTASASLSATHPAKCLIAVAFDIAPLTAPISAPISWRSNTPACRHRPY